MDESVRELALAGVVAVIAFVIVTVVLGVPSSFTLYMVQSLGTILVTFAVSVTVLNRYMQGDEVD